MRVRLVRVWIEIGILFVEALNELFAKPVLGSVDRLRGIVELMNAQRVDFL